MNVIVQSLHFDADIKLISFIQEKVGKLALFHDRIISSDVTLRVGSESERPENKYVELRLAIPGNDLFAKRKAASFEEAAVLAVDALRNQMERERTKAREVRG